MEVRAAATEDCERIATLMRQLGYEVPAEKLSGRLKRRGKRREVFVAAGSDGIAGWAAVSTDEPFVGGFEALLEGLVVDDSTRGRGIGEQLLHAAESWARERGCTVMRVQSNVVRTRAHQFYARQGYATIKSQYQLRKRL